MPLVMQRPVRVSVVAYRQGQLHHFRQLSRYRCVPGVHGINTHFNRTERTIPGLVQNEQIHGSLYNLQPGSSYFVRILATHRAKTIRTASARFETDPEPKLWWESDQKENGSWRTSPWLGTFLPDASGWIYHSEMDWLYA